MSAPASMSRLVRVPGGATRIDRDTTGTMSRPVRVVGIRTRTSRDTRRAAQR
ncbi:hypothetical protein [uncultured Microbacterium sp.]|uniref:Uncharacterized protein n=1 Tax=uncultured Microbacterium sp. TaxID=191216 RepID=A0A1Y5P0N6_9MICO|nr:hypothetical protein [uncultured Microbacterium sp.]SBS72227.1 hypothetical protein MIPYR_20485 [uncultured Microbacterium sp.]